MPPLLIRRVVAACWFGLATSLVAACGGQSPVPTLTVGTTNDSETTLLAQLYAAALRYYGTPARVETTADPLVALDSGAVNVVPGFTGRLLQTFAPGSAARSDKQVYQAMVGVLPEGVAAGDYSSTTDDKPVLVVTDATAKLWGSRDLAATARHCAGMIAGAVEGSAPPPAVGTCALPNVRRFVSEATMFDALRAGTIGAAWTSTAGPELAGGLVGLADRKPELVQAQNVVPLYRRNELSEFGLRAINELGGVLDTEALRDMRQQVASGADPAAVAGDWLATHPLGR